VRSGAEKKVLSISGITAAKTYRSMKLKRLINSSSVRAALALAGGRSGHMQRSVCEVQVFDQHEQVSR
jgi:hypothetical protein